MNIVEPFEWLGCSDDPIYLYAKDYQESALRLYTFMETIYDTVVFQTDFQWDDYENRGYLYE